MSWQISYRIMPYPVLYPFIQDAKLLIEKKMAGATGNIYVGLQEYEEMIFALHLLRNDDVFCDIGANIGSYTVLASKIVGCTSYSFEPVPKTFNALTTNVFLNNITDKVIACNFGLGDTNRTVLFSDDQDTKNHVITDDDNNRNGYISEIKKLDDVMGNTIPTLMKIDVEGFEYFVLKGSHKTLSNSILKSIIIEVNDETKKYNIPKETINSILVKHGFVSVRYNPASRMCTQENNYFSDNRIYIRDAEFVENRCKSAKKISVFNQSI